VPRAPRKPKPLVSVIMGSKSDWETMQHTHKTLNDSRVEHEKKLVSARRTPQWMVQFATAAEDRVR